MKISLILTTLTFLQIACQAKATEAVLNNQRDPAVRPVPMVSDCREVLNDGRSMLTSFFVPWSQDGTQKTVRILRTLSTPSNNPNEPVGSDDPISPHEVIFDVTSDITSIDGEVARLSPTGFVSYATIGTGEIIFDLPDAQEIALIASNCVFPEPGVVVGN